MPQVGLELKIPVFERTKTVHALDHAASVIGTLTLSTHKPEDNSVKVDYGDD
jgi:hypothetical protein